MLALAAFCFGFYRIVSAQGAGNGVQPFQSYTGGPEVINLENLNVRLNVPIINKPGRGSNFSYSIGYDSTVWTPATVNGTLTWQPSSSQWGWSGLQPAGISYVLYSMTYITGNCGYQGQSSYQQWSYSNFSFFDNLGVWHYFPGVSGSYYSSPGGSCPPNGPQPPAPYEPVSQAATDGSGYTMYATMASYAPAVNLTDSKGSQFFVPAATTPPTSGNSSITDRNGNISYSQSNGVYTDTLGTNALSVLGTSPVNLTYTAPSGASASYVVSYKGYIVRTNFGCSTVSDYNSGSTQINLVDRITLPDLTFYQFNYEQTPGFSSDVTGRIASVTLPTGSTITYTYTGGSTGHITCFDGSAPGLTRYAAPDGTWTYTRTAEGAASVTKQTDPQSNDTLIQFQGLYETQRDVYTGAAPSFSTFPIPESTLQASNLKGEIQTCYNTGTTSCTNTAVALPISKKTVTTLLSGASSWANALTSQHIYNFNAGGSLTEQDDYDYGVGAVGSLLKKTTITYATLGNITSFRQQVTVTDGAGATVSQTVYNYGNAVTGTTGTPQHTSPVGSRGNLLSVNYYTNASTYLTQSMSYFDTGNVQTVTDLNGAATTYTYSACGNSFPTAIAEPLTLSKSMTWNCTGGVQLTSVDENSQTTTAAFTDPYVWRPASTTDPANAVTNFTYVGQNTVESSLSFNSGNSAVDRLTTLDGLGRVELNQIRQTPGGANFDSVEQDYDSRGRPSRSTLPYNQTSGQKNPSAPATSTMYDGLGRLSSVTDGGNGSTTYSYVQNDVLVAVGPAPIGENAKRRQLEFDGLGRLTSVCEISSVPGSGACGQNNPQTGFWTKYTYDPIGNLLTVVQNAQATSGSRQSRIYVYDFLSRLTSETNPEIGPPAGPAPLTYTYDTASGCTGTFNGDLVKKVDPQGTTTCFAYDALHRNSSITYSGGYSSVTPNKYFVYDSATVNGVAMTYAKSRLAEAYTCTTCPGTKITDQGFGYTKRGEVSDVYQMAPHTSPNYYHIAQTYWPHGVPSQLSATYNGSAITGLPNITFGGTIGSTVGLDGEGRITQVTAGSGTNPVTSVAYSPYATPPQTAVTLGSLDSDAFTFDANTGRVTQYKFTIGSTPQSVVGNLTWNAIGTLQKLVITDPFNSANAQTCNYTHDDLTRIATANCGSAANQTFSYDPFGNINKQGSPYTFNASYANAATNHISSVGSFTPTYDNNGNVTADGLHTYSWDADGNSITQDTVNLTFDALDRMVEQNRSGAYTQIVYAPTGAKLALMSGSSLQKAFVPLPGGGTAVYTPSGLTYYRHPDWLGSSRFTSNATARTMYSDNAYAPFGETYAQAPGTTPDPNFTGMNSDTSGNSYDFLYRQYSTTGRWPSPDPSGLGSVDRSVPKSWNRYAYALNNPLSNTDPTGLYCEFYENNFGDENDVAEVDDELDAAGCGAEGGKYFDAITTVTVNGDDPGQVDYSGFGINPSLWQGIQDYAKQTVCGLSSLLITSAQLNDGSVGVGTGGSAGAGVLAGVQVQGSAQIVADGSGNVGLAFSLGGNPGFYVAGIGAQGGVQLTNSKAKTIFGMSGNSISVNGSAGPVGVDFSKQSSSVTIGPGVGGKGAAISHNYTWVPRTLSTNCGPNP
jgi:RHS repeat-associated protein